MCFEFSRYVTVLSYVTEQLSRVHALIAEQKSGTAAAGTVQIATTVIVASDVGAEKVK